MHGVPGVSISILLVEDHEANRTVLRRRLERRGYAVAEAADGAEAVHKYASDRHGLVLMDLSMPGMSGFDALAAIRKDDAKDTVPVIALTAHAMDDMREKCAARGFDGFLAKPIDFDVLVSEIGRLVPPEAA